MRFIGRGFCISMLVFAQLAMTATDGFGVRDPKAISVSLVQLLAQGHAFQGRHVRIEGVVRLEHEDTAIYLTREHADHASSENAIWLTLNGDDRRLLKQNNIQTGQYVSVEGVFESKPGGHFELFPGAIQKVNFIGNVTRYEVQRKKSPATAGSH